MTYSAGGGSTGYPPHRAAQERPAHGSPGRRGPRPGTRPPAHPHGPAAFRKPPRRGRTTPLAALTAGATVLLVVVFAFTAWVAPGFLTDDDAGAASGEGARDVAQRIMTGFAEQNRASLRKLACDTAQRPVSDAIAQAHQTSGARLTGPAAVRGGSATAPGRLTMTEDHVVIELVLELRGGSWCWQSLSVPGIELRSPRPTG